MDYSNLSKLMIYTISIGWFLVILYFIIGMFFYKKNKIKILTTKKIVVMSIFLSIFFIQTWIQTLFTGSSQIPFSLKVVTIIVVSTIMGPLEGIIYGIVADSSALLISGYAWDPIAALIYPTYAIIVGSITYAYRNNMSISKKKSFLFAQIPIIIISTFGLFVAIYAPAALDFSGIPSIIIYIISPIMFIVLELILFYQYRKSDEEKMFLFILILFSSVIARIIGGWYLRALSASFWFPTIPFYIHSLSRMITSVYITPCVIIVSFWMVEASNYAMKINNY